MDDDELEKPVDVPRKAIHDQLPAAVGFAMKPRPRFFVARKWCPDGSTKLPQWPYPETWWNMMAFGMAYQLESSKLILVDTSW